MITLPFRTPMPPEAPPEDHQLRFKEDGHSGVDWFPDLVTAPRLDPAPALKLESRGVTSRKGGEIRTGDKPAASKSFWAMSVIHRNTVAAKLREGGMDEEAAILENCHTHTTVAVCNDCGKTSRFENRCDLFYCPQCQIRLQREREDQVRWWAVEIPQPKHVVLTVKNTPTLAPAHVDRLRGWLTKLRRSKFARNWQGGFYRFEVTNEKKGWHLHIHMLVDARWIDQLELKAAWSRITKQQGRIVKVMDCRGESYLHEVTKYVVKGNMLASWSPDKLRSFITAFKGKRTFGVFGSLYGKRTEFAEWIAGLKGDRPKCECGSSSCKFYDELVWQVAQLRLTPTGKAQPPPPPPHAELQFEREFRWPD
jgi:hypothetical protein